MNANLVTILSWTRPYKSAAVLAAVNVMFWFLMHQRPICVMSLAALCYYLRYLWKHRIRPEVLVDPPDSEDWVTLSSYDMEQKYLALSKKLWSQWINMRSENHLMWTTITCTMWIFLAKLGSQVDFVTLLFVISNAAFLLVPLLKICPVFELLPLTSDDGVIKEEDLIPEVPPEKPSKSKSTWSDFDFRPSSSSSSEPTTPETAPHPVRVDLPSELHSARGPSPTMSTSLTENMLTRSMAAAAATFVTSGFTSTTSSVMSASAAVISSLAPQFSQSPASPLSSQLMSSSTALLASSTGPDSLTPGISEMPDHEVVDSDPEDEFLFDTKHFDKSSSSSSTSNSFEIINNI